MNGGTNGRRVGSVGDLEFNGDYFVKTNDEGQILSLWMKLPLSGTRGRIAAKGFGVEGEDEWEISMNEEGLVTVSPSIDEGSEDGFHGHLTDGIWTW